MNNHRIRLTLKYTAILSLVLTTSLLIIYFVSERARRTAFLASLRSEAVTKANLFLENRVDAATMQHIYLNNTQFINEVEVAVYTPDYRTLYHDAAEHDVVKETPEMIRRIFSQGEMRLPAPDGYQAIGIRYQERYVVTAAAHDGYGEANKRALMHILCAIFFVSMLFMLCVGYWLATITIRPIERALASQKMFVSNVSHELRTPLAAIMGELGLALQKERSPEDYQQRISRALDDSRRMSNIVIGLLNMARAEYDASEITMETLRIDELLMDVRDDLLRSEPRYRIDISFAGEPESDDVLNIRANRYLFALALRNLMDNNCKYSPDHTSSVGIRTEGALAVTFSDWGIGMNKEEQKNLFRLFYRGQVSSESGHGIGMALVLRIVTLHGFRLLVCSKEGHGTTFELRF